MSVAEGASDLKKAIERLRGSGIEGGEVNDALKAAIEQGDTASLLAWARARGREHARLGHDLRRVVEELLHVGDALGEDAPRPDEHTGKLSEELVSVGVEAYYEVAAAGNALSHRVEELAALHRIIGAANSSLKLTDMLNETVQAVVAVTGADTCSIFLYEPEWDQLVLAATSGPSRNAVGTVRLQLGEGITGWAALVGKPIAVKDAWADPRFKYIPALQEDKAVSMLAVPVVLFTQEKLVGVITVHTFDEHDFTDRGIKFLETVAGEIAIAIENARLYEQTDAQLQQKVAELSTLQGVSAHIASTLNLPEVLTLIAYQAAHLVRADAAAIYELHPDAGILEMVARYDLQDPHHSIHQAKNVSHITLPVESSSIGAAILKGIPVALPPDADADLGLPFPVGDYHSMFCVPLVAPRNIMGGICLYNRDERTYTDEQARLLDAFAHEAAIALENSRLYDAALRGLRTKSVMLQEMNHRVRNNLQTVAGLLSMQLRRMQPDSEAATAVRESVARVQSIAAVHDLMTGGDVESIGLADLARQVAEAAISTLTRPGLGLSLFVEPRDAESIRVSSHEATLLALLFNELISNAILHGFADRERGEITIKATIVRTGGEREGDSAQRALGRPTPQINIEVLDDGAGLPEGFDYRKDAHLGLSIVQTLVASDLRGDFKIAPRREYGGTVATITFIPSLLSTVSGK